MVRTIKRKEIVWLIIAIYFLILTRFILFKYFGPFYILKEFSELDYLEGLRGSFINANFTPFYTIYHQIVYPVNFRISFENIVGNIILFIPLGFLVPFLVKNFSAKRIIILSFLVSLTFETIQLLLPWFGSFDVDDLILNTSGGYLGYLCFKIFQFFIKIIKQLISDVH